jgi:hypothetical protein
MGTRNTGSGVVIAMGSGMLPASGKADIGREPFGKTSSLLMFFNRDKYEKHD